MKYPVLVMGVILFSIFLSQDTTKKWWKAQMRRFTPSTCDAVKDKVNKTSPGNWEMECPTTQHLILTVDFDEKAKNYSTQRVMMYRQLANIYSKFAHLANTRLEYVEDGKRLHYDEIESLERLQVVRIILKNEQLIITSQSDGQAVAKFLKIKRPQQIAEHLKLTVKVSEKKL
jgi:hypothetical protein